MLSPIVTKLCFHKGAEKVKEAQNFAFCLILETLGIYAKTKDTVLKKIY
jgi:hypothetical protein